MNLRRFALCGLLTIVAGVSHPTVQPGAPGLAIDKAAAVRRLRALPLAFEENRGQTASDVSFVARGQGYAMWATVEGPMLRLKHPGTDKPATFLMRAVGGAGRAAVAEAPLSGRANYFKGNDPSRWVTNVQRYGALRYSAVYEGIDLVLHGTQQSLEYDFEVRPFADPSSIAVAFDGVDDIRVESDGDLSLMASGAAVRFHKPVAFQEGANGREPVAARYELADNGVVRFVLGEYDRSRELVIDPVIDYSTYLSGVMRWNGVAATVPSSDDAYGLTVDASGNAYLTGFTNAIDFPMAGVPFDSTCSGCFSSGGDAFVAKIDPSQSGSASLVFTTYLGALGPGSSGGNAVAVDAFGAAHVTGWTNGYDQVSTPVNEAFPVTASALQPNDGGDLAVLDAFFVKLDATGSTLLYSTYLGSNNVDEGYGVRVDAAGFTYVAGRTAGANFVPLKNGFQMAHASPGLSDAFVVKIDTLASGAASLLYGSFYGGTGNDHVESLAIDSLGRAYVAGDSNSVGNTLPIVNGFLPVTTPGQHAFIAVLDPSLSGAASLYYSTYIGTSGTQGATFREGGIGVDASGIVFMTGMTFGATFATTPGAYRSTVQGAEAFVVKIDPSQPGPASLVAATLLGGSFNDTPHALTVDGGGNPIITGWTQSSDFPVTECGLPKKNSTDAFVTALNKNLTGLLYSTILGGFGNDFGNAVAVGPTGIYVAGGSDSLDYPTTPNAFDPTHNGTINGSGAREAFLTVIRSPYDRCPTPPAAIGANESTPEDTPKSIVLKATDVGGHSTPPDDLSWTITQQPTKGTLDLASGVMTHDAGAAYSVNVIYTPNANTFGADSFKFQVNDGTLNSNIATVSINVTAVNDAPIANAQTVTTQEGTPKHITLTASDAENNNPITFAVTQLPSNGQLIGAGALWTYTPNAGFTGADPFTFTAKDSLNAVSAPAIVTIDVTPINEAPVALDDTASMPEDSPVIIPVLGNDTDADGDTLTVAGATCDVVVPIVQADHTLRVFPPPDFNGTLNCEYTVTDPANASDVAIVTITVTPVNDAPVGEPDFAGTPEDTPIVIHPLTNDSDADGDTLTIDSVSCNAGTPVLIADNRQIEFTPAANFHGPVHCFYIVVDGHGGGDGVDLEIEVSSVNDAPVATDDVATTAEDTPVTIPILLNDTDADGDTLNIAATPVCYLVIPAVNPDGTITITPPPDYHGPIGCSYKAGDNNGGIGIAEVWITVTPVNDAPVANADAVATAEDTPFVIDPLQNDSDADGDTMVITSISCSAGTPVLIALNRQIDFTPPANFHGNIDCSYVVADFHGGSDGADLAIVVTPANDAPLVNNPGEQVTEEGVFISLPLTGSDIDGDSLTFQAAGLPPGLSIGPAGIGGAPAGGSAGSYTVTVTANDGAGGTASATFGWTVTPPPVANQPPVCSAAAPSTPNIWPADDSLVAVGINGVIDPEGPVTIIIEQIFQDEPTDTADDSALAIDGFGIGTPTASVRAERVAQKKLGGDGRVYVIHFRATDAAAASCTGAVTVAVPHSKKDPAIDSGARYDSTIAAGGPAAKKKK